MFKKLLIFTVMVVGIFSMTDVMAANPLGKAMSNLDKSIGGNKTGLERDLGNSIGTVIKGLLSLVGTIFLILTVYAGILWMTAQGNDEKVTKAKGIIQTAVIGLVVVMASYAITAFVTSGVTQSGDSGSSASCSSQYSGSCQPTCGANEIEAPGTDCTGSTRCCYSAP